MLLTLTAAGPGGDHTPREGPHRVVPVGGADPESRPQDVLITTSQWKKKKKKDSFYSAQGSKDKSKSPRRKLLSPIMGDWLGSAALTKAEYSMQWCGQLPVVPCEHDSQRL